MQKTMTTYVKSLSKVKEAEDKEKQLPVALMGATMVTHGDDFEPDSEFGQCLISMLAFRCSFAAQKLTIGQALEEQMSESRVCRRTTWPTQLPAGWNLLSAPLP